MLLDNGRSKLIGTEAQDVLRCIRCAACLNHCPVYGAVGGHAYGATYPGPIGAALNPGLIGIEAAHHHPNASTFLRTLRRSLPGEDPAAHDHAALAGEGIRRRACAQDDNDRPRHLGLRRQAADALSCDDRRREAVRSDDVSMSAREDILGSIRMRTRSKAPMPPAYRAPTVASDLVAAFARKAGAVSADVRMLDSEDEIPNAVAELLRAPQPGGAGPSRARFRSRGPSTGS